MAETIANPQSLSLSKALGQAAKLFRLLEESGLSPEAEQRPIDDPDCRRQLVAYWESLVHPTSATSMSCTLAEAAQIMGDNFHGPAAVKKHLGFNLSRGRQWKSLPFSAADLQAAASTHVLVAAAGLSIMDLQAKARKAFYFQDGPWYGSQREQQAFSVAPVAPGWYLIRKEAMPGSTGRRWSEQQAMVQPPDFVPEANLAAYAWVLHYLATGERLFTRSWVRTDSVAASGCRVGLLGDAGGLYVDRWVDRAVSSIGVAVARKYNLPLAA